MAVLKTILVLLFSVILNNGFSQKNLELLSQNKLKEDFDQLVALIEAHPDPYIHISKDDHHKLLEDIRNKIDKDMNVLEFYKLIAPIYTKLKDGHTALGLNYDWYKKIRKETGVFPIKLFCDSEDRMFVVSNASSKNTIPLGSEILSINGKNVKEFIQSIDHYLSYERVVFRNFQLESGFNRFLIMEFGLRKSTKIKYVHKTVENTINVKHIKYKHWKKGQSDEYDYRRKRIVQRKPWEYKKLKDDIGYLNIFSFRITNKRNYDLALHEIFGKIKNDNLKSLIIDIRGNTGGYPKDVSKLLHFLTQDNFKIMSSSSMKVSQAYKDRYKDRIQLNTNQHGNNNYHIDVNTLLQSENGKFIRQKNYNEDPILMKDEFDGDVYLLTDRRTFSASTTLAAAFKCYYLGLIIGEQTGGTTVFHGNNMVETLKYSKLVATMSTTQFSTPCSEEDTLRGVIPDFELKPNIMNIISEQDLVLSYALRIIKKVEKAKEEKLEKTSGN